MLNDIIIQLENELNILKQLQYEKNSLLDKIMNLEIESENKYPGKLIVYEGIDGSGKSSTAKAINSILSEEGYISSYLFEPTNNHYGRLIRYAAASGKRYTIDEEAALFVKDRAINKNVNLLPGLMSGHILNLDRYFYSSIAYQGASGLTPEYVFHMNMDVILKADLVLIFDVPVDVALKRINTNRENSTAFEKKDFLEKVSAIYKSFEASNIKRIDASKSEENVLSQVLNLVNEVL